MKSVDKGRKRGCAVREWSGEGCEQGEKHQIGVYGSGLVAQKLEIPVYAKPSP
jgi:hypothetical protein